jgi:conjugative relaxase-like TrwC/TraI family protein
MLRIIQNSAPAGAKSYYSTADYYSEGQELTGQWKGRAARLLGLSGKVGKDDWEALCDNNDPRTGMTLTMRQKENRRVGYDFNFHVPKGVSVLYGLTQDERILEAFREAVDATMRDMEEEMQARVRKGGGDKDRTTGNMVWGEFVHSTARPVGGVPDPHLHAHCFVFNTTWDKTEGRWKAGQFAGLKRDAPYFEAVFHSRLARSLADLGLKAQRTRHGWDLAGLPETVVRKFSRRTAEIEEVARQKGITDPVAKGELGAKTRRGKAKELSMSELQESWRSRLSAEEGDAVQALADRIGGEAVPEDRGGVSVAVDRAIGHVFERRSVVPERALLAVALKGGYGEASAADVKRELAGRPLLRAQRSGQVCVTTAEVLAEEQGMVAFAREGRGTCRPLAAGEHTFSRSWLTAEQRAAVQRILGSRDRVILLRGGAGTGKTSLMQEAVQAIEAGGHKVFTFAPSADASRGVLRQEGFVNADTVARLLVDERLQDGLRGQVIWIDEAGLLSARATAKVFDVARKLDARVILSGDKRQHGSVERGSVLRLLEQEAGLVPAEIREIQRQKGDYKRAVALLADGNVEDGFRRLDALGWVRQVDAGERYRVLAADYVQAVAAGKTALVVSPTHREGEWVTAEIREELKRAGKIGREERSFVALEGRDLTEAERGDEASYQPGDMLVFHQNAKGHAKGERLAVGQGPLPLGDAARFQVFQPEALVLAEGDVVRIRRNGATADGKHKLNNGALYTVGGFDDGGNIVLSNGWTIARDFGHLSYGYCATSHASQGKTVDRVFIGQSGHSFGAASREQFYVSVSRGRESAVVYTDDKEALLAAVERSDERVSAIELLEARGAQLHPDPTRGEAARETRSEERAHG